jgi:Flp pilus assembly protein TadG
MARKLTTMSTDGKSAPRGNLARLKQRLASTSGGQAAVELALAMPVLVFVLVVSVQLAIIGTASLALGQVNYQGARYAAVNSSATQSSIQTYMLSVASPMIAANSGQYLTVTVNPAPPCSFGASVTVATTFDVSHLTVLPNPFLGVVTFPTTLSNSQTAFCE